MSEEQTRQRPGPLLGGPNPREERSRRQISWARLLAHAIGAPITVLLMRILWATYRIRVVGDERTRRLIADGTPLVLTLWHGNVFVGAWYLQRLGRLGAGVTYLVSPSVDGDFGVRLLRLVGGRSVRGSATRSGVKAMWGLYRAITRDSCSPVVLPDGPRGPRHYCKPGSLLLAQKAGVPVQPIACAARPSVRVPSWDRQLVPLPFSRVVIAVGEPFPVERGLGEEQLEAARAALEATLGELEEEAERLAGQGRRES